MALKPLASTRTLYVLGTRVGALYSPGSFVTKVFDTPLSVSVTVTVAPATTPPLWSVIVPMIRPKLPCENNGRQSRSTPIAPPSNCTAFRKLTPQNLLLVERKGFISGPPVQNSQSRISPQLRPWSLPTCSGIKKAHKSAL